MMKMMFQIAAVILCLAVHALPAQTDVSTNAIDAAAAKSDFVFVCEVKEESPHAHGPKAAFKSYRVAYPEVLYFGLVGLALLGEIWIHYDSSEFPDIAKSGYETTFHKGDTFIAFLHHVKNSERAFHVVRIDKADAKEKIRRAIKQTPNQVPGDTARKLADPQH